MPPAPHAASITVKETVDLLDGPFAAMAAGIAEDRYALWLGSGISLGRIAGLRRLVPRVLDFLQQRVRHGDPNCRYRKALDEALALANLTEAARNAIDVETPVATWAGLDALTDRLVGTYSKFLEITVDGEEDDHILWDGVDFPSTYADPTVAPDTEHLCIGILILEGIASKIASANWDGLLEQAVQELSPYAPSLVVCVVPADLRAPDLQARLYKFHGCAIRARDDEVNYRRRIIARISQINGWRDDAENAALVGRLVDLAVTSPTLMMGLSAQDGNIQTIFTAAENRMAWPWPSNPPAYVFSEDQLGVEQRALLKNVYHAAYAPANREPIYQSALIRAFAKPLLTALVLHVLCAKLRRLVDMAPGALTPPDRAALQVGILHLRDSLSAHPDAGKVDFVREIIAHTSRLMALYHDGDATPPALPYRPVTPKPVQLMAADYTLGTTGLREFAVGLSLFGLGQREGLWKLEPAAMPSLDSGALRFVGATSPSKLLFAANSNAAINLGLNGHLADGDDAIVVHSLRVASPMARSPFAARGRRGRPGHREVSVAALLDEATSSAHLFERFREELAI